MSEQLHAESGESDAASRDRAEAAAIAADLAARNSADRPAMIA
jgi:hypothetical protein